MEIMISSLRNFRPHKLLRCLIFLYQRPSAITVKGANVTGIEIVTRPLGSVSGRFVLESSKAPECKGKPRTVAGGNISSVTTARKGWREERFSVFRESGCWISHAKGAFTLRNVAEGRYQFDPYFYARYWYLQSITIGCSASSYCEVSARSSKTDAAANWTVLKFGDKLANVTITLAEGAASIRGQVASAEPGTNFRFSTSYPRNGTKRRTFAVLCH